MSRHMTVHANREVSGRSRSIASFKPRSHASTVAATVELVTELLSQDVSSPDTARSALERLQTRTRASKAVVWSVSDTGATRLLSVGGARQDSNPAIDELDDTKILLQRLRRHQAVICHEGEVSGLEALVPEGVRSFIVVASPRSGNRLAVLVIGWDSSYPRCDGNAIAYLRIAATLLHRALTNRPTEASSVADAILGSLADRIAVLDPNGLIVAANAAWTSWSLGQTPDAGDSRPGASYFDAFRRAAANGSPEAASILEGVQAVTRGDSDFLQAAYRCHSVGEDQWGLLTATPFQHPDGGAVVAHADISPEKVTELAWRIGEKLFHRLTDAIPVPIWIVSPEGRLIRGNARWLEIANDAGSRTPDSRDWTDAFHADDRERAVAALRAAVKDRTSFDLELRLKIGYGAYRHSACIGAPYATIDGRIESYVGFCCDISPRQHAELSYRETASKLVSAQEADRSYIGRELHDDLGQRAALLAAQLATLARQPRASAGLRAGLAEAQENLQDLAVAIHNLSHQLHPAKLRLLGLVTTLEALCRDVSKDSAIKVHFHAKGVGSHVPEQVALCIFRVAQEALRNAVKHSAARDIHVRLSGSREQLVLRVKDEGVGFDPLASEATGIGLLTMRERVELGGGQLTIDAAAARGTTIEAVVPLATPPAALERQKAVDSGDRMR
jgi:signal transduction histidine kinase